MSVAIALIYGAILYTAFMFWLAVMRVRNDKWSKETLQKGLNKINERYLETKCKHTFPVDYGAAELGTQPFIPSSALFVCELMDGHRGPHKGPAVWGPETIQ